MTIELKMLGMVITYVFEWWHLLVPPALILGYYFLAFCLFWNGIVLPGTGPRKWGGW